MTNPLEVSGRATGRTQRSSALKFDQPDEMALSGSRRSTDPLLAALGFGSSVSTAPIAIHAPDASTATAAESPMATPPRPRPRPAEAQPLTRREMRERERAAAAGLAAASQITPSQVVAVPEAPRGAGARRHRADADRSTACRLIRRASARGIRHQTGRLRTQSWLSLPSASPRPVSQSLPSRSRLPRRADRRRAGCRHVASAKRPSCGRFRSGGLALPPREARPHRGLGRPGGAPHHVGRRVPLRRCAARRHHCSRERLPHRELPGTGNRRTEAG